MNKKYRKLTILFFLFNYSSVFATQLSDLELDLNESKESNLYGLYEKCSPNVNPKTLDAIIKVESAYNQYAIAVVDGDSLTNQPTDEKSALEALNKLSNKNISVGLMQINKANWNSYNVTGEDLVKDTCKNIYVGGDIISKCYAKALEEGKFLDEQGSLREALSCYYSGNLTRGFKKEGKTSYIDRIEIAAGIEPQGYDPNEIISETENYSVPEIAEKGQVSKSEVISTSNKNAWDVFNDF